jgi:hypothetical protein
MTIADSLQLGKAQLGRFWSLAGRVPRDVLVVAVVLLASSASYGLGYLTGQGSAPSDDFKVTDEPLMSAAAAAAAADPHPSEADLAAPTAPKAAALPAGGQYVASKNGTKFYLPWCGGAKAIKNANKVWFATKADAIAAGYEPAANCKGI